MKELAKQYDPSQVEDRIYQFWLDGGYFHTKADPDKKPYTIVMPPPNVTGQLHMGHAVDNTMQDILIRTKRMQGYAALWVPGTDHASIATEAKVVEAMRAEGLTKEMVGRDGFLERAWAWKTKYGNRIVSQLKKLGSSCDWERERFTMDEGCSEAVKEVFVRLYDKGLIYRGNRMVNWCPHCNTSISDAEVEYEEKDGSFWHLLYPVKETGEMLELATTRPETMLGDTAVAINGDDPRYAHLHGCHVVLPLLNKEIPIVCDEHADMTKGTGVVKITPAHDPNDFEVGLRHDLPIVRVFTYDGRMTGAADKAAADALFAAGKNTVNEPHVLDCGKYAGMTTLEARKAILADLKEGGFLKEIEPLKHEVGTCYRCHSTIEPMVSKQWFVKMEPLAKPAIESVEKGDIKFVPERFTKNYMNWMKNTRDWCISRQLWWGHQIPAWYCDDCGETVVAKSAPCTCPKCGGKGRIIHQPCKDCRGSGMVRKKKTIQASIPAGIDNGQTISIRGQGNAGKNGGPAGDLLITITVRPHELFRREGTSVLCEAPITFTQAVLGAELEIPTIDGKVKYTLPEGTQSGTTFRLKGKGIPSINGRGRGDQYVTVYIETPKNLNKEQKEALKKFAETMGESNYEEQKKFFKKFKK